MISLIDTPDIDFTYEVSRSLAAVGVPFYSVESTVDWLVMWHNVEQNLTIIPVLNKIDLQMRT